MSNMLKRGNAHKTMRVTPNVTDPSMQNGKSQTDMLLMAETGGNDPDIEDAVFHSKTRTREEQQVQPTSSDNTILMIIFALIVIALVAIIVWIIMKQSNDKKEEEEIKRRIAPHQRNAMPAMQQYARYQDPRYADPRYGNNAHGRQPQQHAQTGEQEVEEDEEVHAKTLSEALTKTSKKNDTRSEKDKNAELYNKKHPHPSILRPGGNEETGEEEDVEDDKEEDVEETEENPEHIKAVSKSSKAARSRKNKISQKQSIVDNVMQKTAELLDTDTELTAEDKALLDKAEEEAEDNEDE